MEIESVSFGLLGDAGSGLGPFSALELVLFIWNKIFPGTEWWCGTRRLLRASSEVLALYFHIWVHPVPLVEEQGGWQSVR